MSRSQGESGVVLVHVMMLSLLLLVLASGVLQMVFSNHVLVARVKNSDEKKYWAEACLSWRYSVWDGNPCSGGATDNSCTAGSLGTGSPAITITCSCPTSCQGGCAACPPRTLINYAVQWDGF